MNRPDPTLSLLGLALRGGHLAVGEEPVDAVCRSKHCRLLLLASDAADNTVRRAKHFADAGACILLPLPYTKAELGQAVGRASAAIVAVTDIGLAAAVARRLEQLDPARYGKAVEALDTKARRAQQRREEQRAHEKNVRTGRYKGTAPTPAPAAQEEASSQRKAPSKKDGAPKKEGAAGKNGTYKKRGSSPQDDKTPRRPRSASSRTSNKSNPYAHSRPVKKGKGSFRSSER